MHPFKSGAFCPSDCTAEHDGCGAFQRDGALRPRGFFGAGEGAAASLASRSALNRADLALFASASALMMARAVASVLLAFSPREEGLKSVSLVADAILAAFQGSAGECLLSAVPQNEKAEIPLAFSLSSDARRQYIRGRQQRCAQTALSCSAADLPVRRSCAISKLTFWPSTRLLRPERSTAEIWTNTSAPPWSGAIKPKPFVELNHFTVPVAMMISFPLS